MRKLKSNERGFMFRNGSGIISTTELFKDCRAPFVTEMGRFFVTTEDFKNEFVRVYSSYCDHLRTKKDGIFGNEKAAEKEIVANVCVALTDYAMQWDCIPASINQCEEEAFMLAHGPEVMSALASGLAWVEAQRERFFASGGAERVLTKLIADGQLETRRNPGTDEEEVCLRRSN